MLKKLVFAGLFALVLACLSSPSQAQEIPGGGGGCVGDMCGPPCEGPDCGAPPPCEGDMCGGPGGGGMCEGEGCGGPCTGPDCGPCDGEGCDMGGHGDDPRNTALCSETNVSVSGTVRCTGPADSYRFTIHSFSLLRDDNTLEVLRTADLDFDAATVGAGESMGNYISNGLIPPGTYTKIVPEINRYFRYSGSTTSMDGVSCATDGEGVYDNAEGLGTEVNYEDRGYLNTEHDSVVFGDSGVEGMPMTIVGTESVTFHINFATNKGVYYTFTDGVCVSAGNGDLNVTLAVEIE